MKKRIFLLSILLINTLYSLPKEDWDAIRPLLLRGIRIGVATGIGFPLAYYTEYYNKKDVVIAAPQSSNLADWRAWFADKKNRNKPIISPVKSVSLSDTLALMPITIAAGLYLGFTGAFIHAIIYIAHKYNVSYKEAFNAIQYNLDLSNTLKK